MIEETGICLDLHADDVAVFLQNIQTAPLGAVAIAHHFSSALSASKPETTSNSSSSIPFWRRR